MAGAQRSACTLPRSLDLCQEVLVLERPRELQDVLIIDKVVRVLGRIVVNQGETAVVRHRLLVNISVRRDDGAAGDRPTLDGRRQRPQATSLMHEPGVLPELNQEAPAWHELPVRSGRHIE